MPAKARDVDWQISLVLCMHMTCRKARRLTCRWSGLFCMHIDCRKTRVYHPVHLARIVPMKRGTLDYFKKAKSKKKEFWLLFVFTFFFFYLKNTWCWHADVSGLFCMHIDCGKTRVYHPAHLARIVPMKRGTLDYFKKEKSKKKESWLLFHILFFFFIWRKKRKDTWQESTQRSLGIILFLFSKAISNVFLFFLRP